MTKSVLRIIASCVFLGLALQEKRSQEADACTVIAAGRNATIDGSVMLAHTDDAGGGAADLRLVRVPAMDHPVDSKRAVYNFFNGYPRVVTRERGEHYLPNEKLDEQEFEPLGFIPQVEHTYAYFDQDYGMMNEVQLSIAESTCAAKTVGWPSDVSYGYNLFGIAELTKVALERCDNARCAVQTMGDLAVQYGFYSEDSGDPAKPGYADSAEALAIGDKYGEVWVFHVLTGKNNASAVWAAQRVPVDHVTSIANGFIIREMDLEDKHNFLASDNVKSFAAEMGWWKEGAPFDFTEAYGYHDDSALRPLYVGRRIWRIFDVLAPSLKLDSTLASFSQYATYPFSIKPDEKVTLEKLMSLMRDHYEGTQYDMTKGVAAGPFGNPVRFDGPMHDINGGWERAISMYRTMFSFVLQARDNREYPDYVGGVAWYGQDAPHGSVYVPFGCGQTEVPGSYLKGKQSEFDQESAWWAFNFVNNWSMLRFNAINGEVREKIDVLQKNAFEKREQWEKQALQELKRLSASTDKQHHDDNQTLLSQEEKKKIINNLQSQTNAFAAQVVDDWWQFAWKLVAKYSDGYITTGEKPSEMKTVGYPKWWLQVSDFAAWPGDTFAPRDSVKHELIHYTPPAATTSAPVASSAENHFTRSGNGESTFVEVVGWTCFGVVIGVVGLNHWQKRQRRTDYHVLA